MLFENKDLTPKPGFNVGIMLNRTPTEGHVGLEIEVEGVNLPYPPNAKGASKPVRMPKSKFWSYVHDGSLRGEENAEYVLNAPIDFKIVPKAVDELWGIFKEHGSQFTESNRTSVHVHLNCQEFHLNRLAAFTALYFTLEELLTDWCGEHRVGNLFCLRAKDAPGIVAHLKSFLIRDGSYELRDNLHYSGLNIHALTKFGSIEVRSLRGVDNPQTLLDWIAMLKRIYDKSAVFTDPRDVCGLFSAVGPYGFLENILEDTLPILRNGISRSEEDIKSALYTGIRLAQELCYCRDWDLYQPMTMQPDPFGRRPSAVANKLLQAIAGDDVPELIYKNEAEFMPEFDDLEDDDYEDEGDD